MYGGLSTFRPRPTQLENITWSTNQQELPFGLMVDGWLLTRRSRDQTSPPPKILSMRSNIVADVIWATWRSPGLPRGNL